LESPQSDDPAKSNSVGKRMESRFSAACVKKSELKISVD
jgi:hypothetical protein